jgi:hypothetical protein
MAEGSEYLTQLEPVTFGEAYNPRPDQTRAWLRHIGFSYPEDAPSITN